MILLNLWLNFCDAVFIAIVIAFALIVEALLVQRGSTPPKYVLARTFPILRLTGSWPLLREAVSGSERNAFNSRLKESMVLCGVAVVQTNDLRRYPRIPSPKGTLVAWQSSSKKDVSRVVNLGLGGLYIRTSEPPPPGTFIQLLLDVPAGEVRARALVQRTEPKLGMGVKFIAMQHEDRGRLAQWLNTLAT